MRISVAMATYKGEAFIEAQLRSILSQSLLPAEIIVCDDNSSDGTVKIIRTIAKTSPIPIRVYINKRRLGPTRNFEKAIAHAKYETIALADQDDVWLPNKLEISAKALQKLAHHHGSNTPLLVHTDLTVTNAELQLLHPSFFRLMGLHPYGPFRLLRLIARNSVTGCTVLFNRALAQAALPFPPSCAMHDHWLAMVALRKGALITLPSATVLYRQHGNNQVGARKRSGPARFVLSAWKKFQQANALIKR